MYSWSRYCLITFQKSWVSIPKEFLSANPLTPNRGQRKRISPCPPPPPPPHKKNRILFWINSTKKKFCQWCFIWMVSSMVARWRKFASTNQKHNPDLDSTSDVSWVWNFCTFSSTSFGKENSGGVAKSQLLLRLSLSKIVLFQKISILHHGEFPGLQPPPPLLPSFIYFGFLQLPPSQNFQWPSIRLIWIFSGTIHHSGTIHFQIPAFYKSQMWHWWREMKDREKKYFLTVWYLAKIDIVK